MALRQPAQCVRLTFVGPNHSFRLMTLSLPIPCCVPQIGKLSQSLCANSGIARQPTVRRWLRPVPEIRLAPFCATVACGAAAAEHRQAKSVGPVLLSPRTDGPRVGSALGFSANASATRPTACRRRYRCHGLCCSFPVAAAAIPLTQDLPPSTPVRPRLHPVVAMTAATAVSTLSGGLSRVGLYVARHSLAQLLLLPCSPGPTRTG